VEENCLTQVHRKKWPLNGSSGSSTVHSQDDTTYPAMCTIVAYLHRVFDGHLPRELPSDAGFYRPVTFLSKNERRLALLCRTPGRRDIVV